MASQNVSLLQQETERPTNWIGDFGFRMIGISIFFGREGKSKNYIMLNCKRSDLMMIPKLWVGWIEWHVKCPFECI